jgi:hypothetical protein
MRGFIVQKFWEYLDNLIYQHSPRTTAGRRLVCNQQTPSLQENCSPSVRKSAQAAKVLWFEGEGEGVGKEKTFTLTLTLTLNSLQNGMQTQSAEVLRRCLD